MPSYQGPRMTSPHADTRPPNHAEPESAGRSLWPLYAALACLPLVPYGVLAGRDWLWQWLDIPLVDTPQGTLYAWELWVIAAVSWGTLAAVAAGDMLASLRRPRGSSGRQQNAPDAT